MPVVNFSSLRITTNTCSHRSNMLRIQTRWCIRIQITSTKTLIWCSSNILVNRWCRCNNMTRILKEVFTILPKHPSWNRWQNMKKTGNSPISNRTLLNRDLSIRKVLNNNKCCHQWDNPVREATLTQAMGRGRQVTEFRLITKTWTQSCRHKTHCIVPHLVSATKVWHWRIREATLVVECFQILTSWID